MSMQLYTTKSIVRKAKHKVKLTFIVRSGSNCSVFYLFKATSLGLNSNPLLCACVSM